MLDPAAANVFFPPPPTSPTISSSASSSSDLDTESTGSFFHDRSTTLGTLMGVTTFPPITFRAPSQRRDTTTGIPAANARRTKKKNTKAAVEQLMRGRRRWWWRLCSDEELKPSKLGEFLEVERRFGDEALFDFNIATDNNSNGRLLFADGRVLPPAADTSPATAGGGLCRCSVPLPGICSGGLG